jgi:hypothetical protein
MIQAGGVVLAWFGCDAQITAKSGFSRQVGRPARLILLRGDGRSSHDGRPPPSSDPWDRDANRHKDEFAADQIAQRLGLVEYVTDDRWTAGEDVDQE